MIPVECYIIAASLFGALIGWAGRSASAGREIARARNAAWRDCLRCYRISPEFVAQDPQVYAPADYGTPVQPLTRKA